MANKWVRVKLISLSGDTKFEGEFDQGANVSDLKSAYCASGCRGHKLPEVVLLSGTTELRNEWVLKDFKDESRATLLVIVKSEKLCASCGERGEKKCAGCKMVRYCGVECQMKDWRLRHKQECRRGFCP